MLNSKRKYTGPLQFFHNYEHDPEGRTHCLGPKSNPYIVVHKDGKHVINVKYAKGHDKKGDSQWFEFTQRLGGGYDLASGKPIDETPPESKKKPVTKAEIFEKQRLEQMRLKRRLGH